MLIINDVWKEKLNVILEFFKLKNMTRLVIHYNALSLTP